ncbi:uncharacterized protein TNCV_182341 [Trichonephila clavipes]|nr:uncharacterized protein TNCV_182341 [Trichonephila clavipes]
MGMLSGDYELLLAPFQTPGDGMGEWKDHSCSSSPRLIEDETFNDNDIINNLIDYEDGQEEPESLRADTNMQGSSFPTNWESIFLK